MFTRLDTMILRVRDVGAALRWYADVLQLSPSYVDADEGLAVLDMEGTSLTLWQLRAGEEPAPGDAAGSFPIFGVSDAAVAHERLRGRGVAVDPLQAGPGVHFFTFRDPDGNRLEACEVLAG